MESLKEFFGNHSVRMFLFGLLAITGGLLAVAYSVQSEILAVHIGASTPVILETLARAGPDSQTSAPEAQAQIVSPAKS
jgi:hypothetical protein